MKTRNRCRPPVLLASGFLILSSVALVLIAISTGDTIASGFSFWRSRSGCGDHGCCGPGPCAVGPWDEVGGTWYWLHSPDDEKRVIMGLYNRYCIRCHGADGRGVWDIPDVPDFTNACWQASRSDHQIARAILEGRGACMPPFRGTLTLEEACGMARYLRTFLPGTEVSKPDTGQDQKKPAEPTAPAPKKTDEPAK